MALPINLFMRGVLITSGAVAGATVAGWYWGGNPVGPKEPEGPNDNEGLNGKIKSLGISNVQCLFSNGENSRECELDLGQMNAINFYDKDEGVDYPIVGLEGGRKISLRMEKGYGSEYNSDGIRFTFTNKNTNDVTLGSEGNSQRILKTNSGYDYKIYDDGSGNLQLMKAWTLQSLGQKVGLNVGDSNDNSCELGDATVNVWRKEGDHVVGAKVANKCFMEVAKDAAGYAEGFKFTLKGEQADMELTGGEKPEGATVDKLTKNNTSYEIGNRVVKGERKWFLIVREG